MPESIQDKFLRAEPRLQTLCEQLEKHAREALGDVKHIDRISFRVKRLDSFIKKAATRENGNLKYHDPFEEIEDFIAGRVIVFFLADIPNILRELDKRFGRVEGDHREPSRDAEFGYESSHRVYHIASAVRSAPVEVFVPRTFEMQVRTIFMHAYAEPQHDLDYKGAGDLPREIRRELAWIAASAWGADQAFQRVNDWDKSR